VTVLSLVRNRPSIGTAIADFPLTILQVPAPITTPAVRQPCFHLFGRQVNFRIHTEFFSFCTLGLHGDVAKKFRGGILENAAEPVVVTVSTPVTDRKRVFLVARPAAVE